MALSAFDRGSAFNNALKEMLKISPNILLAMTKPLFILSLCFHSQLMFFLPGQASSGDGDGAPAPHPLQGDREQRWWGGGDQAVLQQEGKWSRGGTRQVCKYCMFPACCFHLRGSPQGQLSWKTQRSAGSYTLWFLQPSVTEDHLCYRIILDLIKLYYLDTDFFFFFLRNGQIKNTDEQVFLPAILQ